VLTRPSSAGAEKPDAENTSPPLSPIQKPNPSQKKPHSIETAKPIQQDTVTPQPAPPPSTVISAPNGIAIGGGSVSNPTVNNYAPIQHHISEETNKCLQGLANDWVSSGIAKEIAIYVGPESHAWTYGKEIMDIFQSHSGKYDGSYILIPCSDAIWVQIYDQNNKPSPNNPVASDAQMVATAINRCGVPVDALQTSKTAKQGKIEIWVCSQPKH
jgi:hypothetical protein